VRSDKYQAGDHPLVDANPWKVGITTVQPIPAGATGFPGFFFVHYKEVLPPDLKKLPEVRGLMISQYQEQLEKEWLEQLKLKYHVEVVGSELEKLYQ
jgi:peptidyl-prolyl cis-trans isomerase SurA